jgi:hypothetical protein
MRTSNVKEKDHFGDKGECGRILWHVDPLLGNDGEISRYIRAAIT